MKQILRNAFGHGFTLIELLIVVAIIAILAAIAVPNFLEAQTRSKVSRCAADMRSIRTGIESYRVDNNQYFETDEGVADLRQGGCGMIRMTTPIAYMATIPKSPFKETEMGWSGTPKYCVKNNTYLYVRALTTNDPTVVDTNYQNDRKNYVSMQSSLAENLGCMNNGYWELKSVGPDNLDDYHEWGNLARPYDPTNGTASRGDLVIFGDVSRLTK